MKKTLFTLGLLVIIGISQTAYSQEEVKPWQFSFSAVAGTNYTGMDFSGTLATRIATSNFGVFGGFTYGKEKLKVYQKGIRVKDLNEIVKSSVVEAGFKYSLYNIFAPLSINIEPFVGFCYDWENGVLDGKNNNRDGEKRNDKTIGNLAGINLEFFLSRNFSIILKQNGYYLYNSDFGNFRGASLLGVNINF